MEVFTALGVDTHRQVIVISAGMSEAKHTSNFHTYRRAPGFPEEQATEVVGVY